jgi:PIN domain nuclease of toxin-antitoxin system
MGKMTLLLDTHIFLWWLFDDHHLPAGIRAVIEDPDNQILVSSASVWEITTKFRLGRLPKASRVAGDVPAFISKAGFQAMPILPDHAQLAGEWDLPHRDPFDRMLAAQAKLARIPLATVDKALWAFPIEILSR